MHLKKIGFIAVIIVGFSFLQTSTLLAQDQEWKQYDLKYRSFRFTLIPGISTNGLGAPYYAAKYSFNIIAGYNGALEEGFEFGTLLNINKYYATGVQIAGLANYSGEQTAGFQLAGIANISEEELQGIQLAGAINYSGDATQGIQISGIGNYSNDLMQGIQLAGAANISQGDMQGIQLAGILNLSMAESQGLQASGVLNFAKEVMQGLYWAGVGNYTSGEMQGLIFSGVFNVAEEIQGIVASGLFNYSENFQGIELAPVNISQNFQGIQIGQVNIAEEGEGIQVGLINYASEFQGLPVGLISYYGNGRKNIDFWISDGGFTNFGLKLGTDKIYNMISIGYNTLLNRNVWQIGWSIGRLQQYKTHFTYSDFSYFKINEGGWTEDFNSIFKYRLLFGKEILNGFNIYGGPTFNLLISGIAESDDYTWYRIIDYEAKGTQYVFWVGFTLGTQLF
ncbi:MAG TPA: hypothetical protein VF181_05800 [Balneolaceae bacterium]